MTPIYDILLRVKNRSTEDDIFHMKWFHFEPLIKSLAVSNKPAFWEMVIWSNFLSSQTHKYL
jgi:hypothetical protein